MRKEGSLVVTSASERSAVAVLEITAPPDGTTRYIDQVVTMAHPSVTFGYFSWKRAFFGRYDVVHVHWPEMLTRRGHTRIRRARGTLLLLLLIAALRLRRIPIVRTLHNIDPHEHGSRVERRVLALLDRATDVFVTINPVTRVARGEPVHIPHGHYRDRFAMHPGHESDDGTLVYAGLIRPYKGVERLIEAFEGLPADLAHRLRIVGRPTDDLRKIVDAACLRDPRITARLEFVSDNDLVAELSSAELVCLPYDEMHNSGMALVGLSLDRPVMVPDTPTTRSLSSEVGVGWMHLLDGPLTARRLEQTIRANRAVATRRGTRPVLEDRDWNKVAERYERVFRQAIGERSVRRRGTLPRGLR